MISELIRQNAALENFAYEVSHSLRAPVANLMGLSQILETMEVQSAEQRQVACHMQQSLEVLNKKILDLNHILSKKSPSHPHA